MNECKKLRYMERIRGSKIFVEEREEEWGWWIH